MLDVLFCDNHLLVISKPAMLSTQPATVGEACLEDFAKEWLLKETGKAVFLEPIHRLDKPASGIVVFARSSKALSRLNNAMRERQIDKTYFAFVEGTLPSKEGQLEHFLRHGDFRADVVSSEKAGGKRSLLTYKVLSTHGGQVLLQIQLITGRYHQIRAQLSAIGCPIIGDKKYGSRHSFPSGIALHHGEISFIHPVTKEKLRFSLVPEWMKEISPNAKREMLNAK